MAADPEMSKALSRLCDWGAAEDVPEGRVRFVAPFCRASLALFAPLLDSLRPELFDIAAPGCPFVLKAAFPGVGARLPAVPDAVMRSVVSGGQGLSPAAAVLSCLGELAERASLLRRGAEDPRVFKEEPGVHERPLGPILGFSRKQEAALMAARPNLPPVTGEDGSIDWNRLESGRVRLRDLASGEDLALPACGVFVETDPGAPAAGLGLGSTIGAAVWTEAEGARRAALLELLERDTVARAWYNRLGITSLSSRFWSQVLTEEAAAFLQGRARITRILVLDCDFDAHVVAALSHDDQGREAAFGSAASLALPEAAESAVREMIQSERSHEFARKAWEAASSGKGGSGGKRKPLPPPLAYGASVDIRQDLSLDGVPSAEVVPSRVYRPDEVLEGCLSRGIRLYEFDATAPDLRIPCIKLLSPDLCTWQPRFGKARLFAGGSGEADFMARAFPF